MSEVQPTAPDAPNASITAANQVVVHGHLVARRRGRREVTSSTTRNDLGAVMRELDLQVASPIGDPFTIPFSTSATTQGNDMLATAKEGDPIGIVGTIRLRRVHDTRFTADLDDPGRETRELDLQVAEIISHDTEASSAVWLEGIVAEPPRIMRHPDYPDIQLAVTELGVTVRSASTIAGSRSLINTPARVIVAIPTSDSAAGALYREGNVVRIEGQLDAFESVARGTEIAGALSEIHTAFQAERDAISDESIALAQRDSAEAMAAWTKREDERRATAKEKGRTFVPSVAPRRTPRTVEEAQRQLMRTFQRRHDRVATAMFVYVLVGYVELINGHPASMDDARAARRAILDERATRRKLRAERERQRGRSGAANGAGQRPAAPIAAASPAVAAPGARVQRPADSTANGTARSALAPAAVAEPTRPRARRAPASAPEAAPGVDGAASEPVQAMDTMDAMDVALPLAAPQALTADDAIADDAAMIAADAVPA